MKRDIFMIHCLQACVQEMLSSVDFDRRGKQLSEVDMKNRETGRRKDSTRHPSLHEMNSHHLFKFATFMIK